jgi:transposase
MPNERIAMRHVREVLRLKSAGVPIREVARRVGTAPSTVRLTLKRAASAGVFWPVEENLSDGELEQLHFVQTSDRRGHRRLVEPDWSLIHCELKRNKHLTLQVPWEEYLAREPNGFRYSRFCQLYRQWQGRLSVTMRQSHIAFSFTDFRNHSGVVSM